MGRLHTTVNRTLEQPAFHARVRGSVPSLGGLKETKMFLPHPRVLWGASVTER